MVLNLNTPILTRDGQPMHMDAEQKIPSTSGRMAVDLLDQHIQGSDILARARLARDIANAIADEEESYDLSRSETELLKESLDHYVANQPFPTYIKLIVHEAIFGK